MAPVSAKYESYHPSNGYYAIQNIYKISYEQGYDAGRSGDRPFVSMIGYGEAQAEHERGYYDGYRDGQRDRGDGYY